MSKTANQKLKLLYLMKIMLEETDENHPISVPELIAGLSHYGIQAERKSIYDDLQALSAYGLDIASKRGKSYGYFIAERDFELPELRLLADSVASSKFISEKKSRQLIKKISALASRHEASKIKRQVYVTNRVKTMNERSYHNIDAIHQAIFENRQLHFKYFKYNTKKERLLLKEDGYIVSPYALVWSEENYYLVALYEKHQSLLHFRIDRMEDCQLIDTARVQLEKPLNIADYCKSHFSMFGASEQHVQLRFNNELINVVIDQFGKDVSICTLDENNFFIQVKIAPTSTFLGWLLQFGEQAEVLAPEELRARTAQSLEKTLRMYKP